MTPSTRSPIKTQDHVKSRFSGKDFTKNSKRRSRDRSPSREQRSHNILSASKNRYINRSSRSPSNKSPSPTQYRVRRQSKSPSVQKSSKGSSRKIFIANLSRNVETIHLKEIFGSFGELECCDISKYDDFPFSNSFGHIIYKNIESSQRAMKHMHRGQIDGLVIDLEYVPYSREGTSKKRSKSISLSDN